MIHEIFIKKEAKENLNLVAYPRLLSVDGPDGVGKGIFVAEFANIMAKIYGNQSVVSTSGTRFEACSKSQILMNKLKTTSNILERNKLFLYSTKIIFKEIVIPSLNANKIVILDSSDLRHLAFVTAVHGENSSVWKDTFKQIADGVLTYRHQPGVRIILTASPYDLLLNLRRRGSVDEGDPTNKKEAKKRLEAYKKTIKIFKNLPIIGNVKWIEAKNSTVPSYKIQKHLEKIIQEIIIPKLNLSSFRYLNHSPEKHL